MVSNPVSFSFFLFPVFRLLLIGAFLVVFDIGAHILFFQSYDSDMIPLAYVISAIMGLIYMWVYTILFKPYEFQDLYSCKLYYHSACTVSPVFL